MTTMVGKNTALIKHKMWDLLLYSVFLSTFISSYYLYISVKHNFPYAF